SGLWILWGKRPRRDHRVCLAGKPEVLRLAGERQVIVGRSVWIVTLACAGLNVAAADEPTAPVAAFRTDWGIQLGPITLTPGGFLEFTSIYRERNQTADIGSSFAGIPF